MRRDILIAAALAAVSANGAAIEKRQSNSTGLGDGDILNFALVLEHLEATFYSQALSKFDQSAFTSAGFTSNVRANIQRIAADEAQHVSFLTSALKAAGATPVSACNYTFPYSDVKGFLGLSQVLEGVGVSAYLGAAGLISNKAYLTAAGSILTAEARHSAFIRAVNQYSSFTTEDTPLDPTAVTTLAAPFFSSCPSGSAPPFKPFPSANLTSTNYTIGSTINIASANATAAGNSSLYCIIFSGLNQAVSPYQNGTCQIPSTNVTSGQAYAVISKSQTFSDDNVVAGPVVLQFDTKNNTGFGTPAGNSSGVGAQAAATNPNSAGFKITGSVAGAGLALVAAVASLVL